MSTVSSFADSVGILFPSITRSLSLHQYDISYTLVQLVVDHVSCLLGCHLLGLKVTG